MLSIDDIASLFMLIALLAVLGFDNLLYISLESKRAPEAQQASVRRWGIGIAVGLRIVLLFALVKLVDAVKEPLIDVHWDGVFTTSMNLHSMIVLIGGAFILYTATKEVLHMMSLEDLQHGEQKQASATKVIAWIVTMNLVFSFDSILSAMALTDKFWIMAVSIIICGFLMIWLADHVSEFLKKNRMYEVLGLFILFVVGIMLLTEGGHLAHITFFDNEIVPMSKTTFYFVIAVLVCTDIVQTRYQKRLNRLRELSQSKPPSTSA